MTEPATPVSVPPMLAVGDVACSFGGLRALDGASLSVERGSITALIGPNGAGKTTLFNVVTGFERADRGRVRYDGRDVLGLPPHAIARAGMVRTFQLTRTLAAMTVLENVLVAAPDHPGEHLVGLLGRRVARRRERDLVEQAQALLDRFELAAKSADHAGTLSGGQRKLLELARALMLRPRLVLLDEPMAGVNRTLGRDLLEHIEHLRDTEDITFLFIEHDMEIVMAHAEHVIVLAQGRTIATGAPDVVRADPAVVDAYLGTAPA